MAAVATVAAGRSRPAAAGATGIAPAAAAAWPVLTRRAAQGLPWTGCAGESQHPRRPAGMRPARPHAPVAPPLRRAMNMRTAIRTAKTTRAIRMMVPNSSPSPRCDASAARPRPAAMPGDRTHPAATAGRTGGGIVPRRRCGLLTRLSRRARRIPLHQVALLAEAAATAHAAGISLRRDQHQR